MPLTLEVLISQDIYYKWRFFVCLQHKNEQLSILYISAMLQSLMIMFE